MRIGHVQDARIAEAFEIVNAGVIGGAADSRQSARKHGGTGEFQQIAAADRHVVSPPIGLSEFPYLSRAFFRLRARL